MRWLILRAQCAVLVVMCLTVLHCHMSPPMRSTNDRPPTSAELSELWVSPSDVASRDLFYGIGGAPLAPDPQGRFEFVSEKHELRSYSPGCTVRDANGLTWTVKLGKEVHAEVLASRLIWAAGFHQPPVYYVPHWQYYRDGKAVAQPPGRFRPKLRRYKKRATWSWQQNPFVGTQPYRGLIVLMVMLNNWDLTDGNNALYDLREPWDGARRWYVTRDVGAAFSANRGPILFGTRGDPEGFAHQPFIDSVKDGRVVFAWNGRHADLIQNLTPDDVHWAAERLAALSATQWDDAFRAAGYTADEASLIRGTIDQRIAQARNL